MSRLGTSGSLRAGRADAGWSLEAERVLEAAALRPGDTVLDVGPGWAC